MLILKNNFKDQKKFGGYQKNVMFINIKLCLLITSLIFQEIHL